MNGEDYARVGSAHLVIDVTAEHAEQGVLRTCDLVPQLLSRVLAAVVVLVLLRLTIAGAAMRVVMVVMVLGLRHLRDGSCRVVVISKVVKNPIHNTAR